MTAHLPQNDLDRLGINDLNTTEWARVRRHLFECDTCLHRLLDKEGPLRTNSTSAKRVNAPAISPAIRAFVY